MRLHDNGKWSCEPPKDLTETWESFAMHLVPCETTGPVYEYHPWKMKQEVWDNLRPYLGYFGQPNPAAF